MLFHTRMLTKTHSVLTTGLTALVKRWLGAIGLLASLGYADPLPVNFTLSLNTAKDSGQTYDNLHKAAAGIDTSFVIGFQIDIHSVNGVELTMTPVAAFCSEIEESIAAETYGIFQATDLAKLAEGRAGEAGTASSAIPIGGIGNLRAARVNYLFEHFYISEALTEWTITEEQPTTQAFQLALWELTHDSDLSLVNTDGDIYIGAQTAGTTTQQAQRNNAITLAQSMLDDIGIANISESYVSSKFELWGLVNAGSPGKQDVVLALEKESSNFNESSPLLPAPSIPEPMALSFVLLAGGGMLFIKRRFST